MIECSPSVEETYQTALDRLPPVERIARGMAMLDWTRRCIGRQTVAEKESMPAERLRLEVARRLYRSEPATCRLIDAAIVNLDNHVSG